MKEVSNSFAIECSGANDCLENAVGASVTVFVDGHRQVGCPYINSFGDCQLVEDNNPKNKVESTLNSQCAHLFPVDSKEANE